MLQDCQIKARKSHKRDCRPEGEVRVGDVVGVDAPPAFDVLASLEQMLSADQKLWLVQAAAGKNAQGQNLWQVASVASAGQGQVDTRVVAASQVFPSKQLQWWRMQSQRLTF